jgi:hypothetical protein
MQAVLDVLRAAAPHALPIEALFDRVRARPDGKRLLEQGDSELQSVALACLQAGVIEPHVIAPRLAFPPGERPAASAVARAQLADGEFVTSLWHCPIKVDDEVARRLLPLLDGTRDRQELLAAIAGLAGCGTAAALDEHLRRLGRLGLLIA